MNAASQNGHMDVVRALLGKAANVNTRNKLGEGPVYLAAQGNYKGLVQLLIKEGADLTLTTNQGHTPLFACAQRDFREVAELLLTEGIYTRSQDSGYGSTSGQPPPLRHLTSLLSPTDSTTAL